MKFTFVPCIPSCVSIPILELWTRLQTWGLRERLFPKRIRIGHKTLFSAYSWMFTSFWIYLLRNHFMIFSFLNTSKRAMKAILNEENKLNTYSKGYFYLWWTWNLVKILKLHMMAIFLWRKLFLPDTIECPRAWMSWAAGLTDRTTWRANILNLLNGN